MTAEVRELVVEQEGQGKPPQINPGFGGEWTKSIIGTGLGVGGGLGLAIVFAAESPPASLAMFMVTGVGAYCSVIDLQSLFKK